MKVRLLSVRGDEKDQRTFFFTPRQGVRSGLGSLGIRERPGCHLLPKLPTTTYSTQCDSFHSWSSNSRWIVFSSKRDDGLFARPYFSYLDADGKAHKPFVLPQEDPTYYDSCIRTYNAPELATAPVPASRRELGRVIRSPGPDESIKAVLDPRVPPRAEPADAEPEPPWKPAGSPPDPSDRRAGRHDGG